MRGVLRTSEQLYANWIWWEGCQGTFPEKTTSVSGTTPPLTVVSAYQHHPMCFWQGSLISVCRLHPATMILMGWEEGTPFVFFLIYFFPLFNVTFFHLSDCFRLLLLVGRVGWMTSSSSPFPSPLRALLHTSLGWERQRGRVFLMPRAWKGLRGYFAWFLFQAEIHATAQCKARKSKMKKYPAPVPGECCVDETLNQLMCLKWLIAL